MNGIRIINNHKSFKRVHNSQTYFKTWYHTPIHPTHEKSHILHSFHISYLSHSYSLNPLLQRRMLPHLCRRLSPCRHSFSSLFGTFSDNNALRLVPCRFILWNPASSDSTYGLNKRFIHQEWILPFRFPMVSLEQ